MRRVGQALVPVFFILVASRLPAQEVLPVGKEFQVNSYTPGEQRLPKVAMGADGSFVVVWETYISFVQSSDIRGQRYDAPGVPAGGEFEVNTYTPNQQSYAAVAMDTDGSFIVVWASFGSSFSDTSSRSIQGQRFDASGMPDGGQFQVNTYTTDDQTNASVAMLPGGGFVVVWRSNGSAGTDNSEFSIQGQRFDASGNPEGGEFQVNTYTTGNQFNTEVAADSSGGFVVVWDGSDNGNDDIRAQRFDATGMPDGSELAVSDGNRFPSVAVQPTGEFLVAWHGTSSEPSSEPFDILGRLYDASGMPVGGEFQVNSNYESSQKFARVAAEPDGGFVVIWEKYATVGSNVWGVQGQRLDALGMRVDSEFQVSSYTAERQEYPALAVDGVGGFVVVWGGEGGTGSDTDYSIHGRRYLPTIFADDFESGDTDAWSG